MKTGRQARSDSSPPAARQSAPHAPRLQSHSRSISLRIARGKSSRLCHPSRSFGAVERGTREEGKSQSESRRLGMDPATYLMLRHPRTRAPAAPPPRRGGVWCRRIKGQGCDDTRGRLPCPAHYSSRRRQTQARLPLFEAPPSRPRSPEGRVARPPPKHNASLAPLSAPADRRRNAVRPD